MDTVPYTELIADNIVDYLTQACFDLTMHTGLSVLSISLNSIYILPRYMLFSGIPENTELLSVAFGLLKNALPGFYFDFRFAFLPGVDYTIGDFDPLLQKEYGEPGIVPWIPKDSLNEYLQAMDACVDSYPSLSNHSIPILNTNSENACAVLKIVLDTRIIGRTPYDTVCEISFLLNVDDDAFFDIPSEGDLIFQHVQELSQRIKSDLFNRLESPLSEICYSQNANENSLQNEERNTLEGI